MKEFLKALIYVILFQVLGWGIFIFCDELPFLSRSNAETLSMIFSFIYLVITLVFYLLYEKKIIKKLNIIKFDISLIVLWVLFSILGIQITMYLLDEGILHYCYSGEDTSWMPCFLNGIEYLLFGIGLILQSIIFILLKVIYFIYKLFKARGVKIEK